MIPPDYQDVAVRLARLGRNDAYVLCQAAIAARVPALDLLCQHLDATLARYRALPTLTNCASTPKMPAKAATPAQAPTKPDPAPSVATPTDVGHVARPARPEPAERGKHGADDAAKRAALRAAMAEGQNSPTNEPMPDTVIEPQQAPIHQLPSRGNMGELYLDSVAALNSLGYCKSEARRMAKAAVEAGAQDIGQVIRACTRKAK